MFSTFKKIDTLVTGYGQPLAANSLLEFFQEEWCVSKYDKPYLTLGLEMYTELLIFLNYLHCLLPY